MAFGVDYKNNFGRKRIRVRQVKQWIIQHWNSLIVVGIKRGHIELYLQGHSDFFFHFFTLNTVFQFTY